MKILAIDYGLKRCGLAVTDELQIIASALTTVDTKLIFSFIEKYLKENKVESFVLGEPKRLSGEDTHSSEPARKFAQELNKRFPEHKIHWVDERFTSKMAQQVIAQSGMGKKKRQDKKLLDEVSATIILQSYLYSKK